MSVLVYDCGSVENTVTAILDTESGAMIIRGNGDIDNYADESSPWYSEHSDILQVTVDKGITRIGSGTFYGCENLSFVEIANTVTSMGADVFQNCTSLTSIKIPKSITAIGNGTFADSGLTEVKFYGNPPNVGTDIFDGVTADVYTPEGNEEWTETAKGTVAGNGSNLTWKEFDSKPNLIEYDELDYLWSKIKKYVDSNVSVTQVVSSGTKIATITINGVDTDIYANSSGLSGTVGSSTTPIYIDDGTPTACGGSLDVDITGNAATATSSNSATTATNANNVQISKITDNDEHPFLFGTTFTNSTTNQAIHHACPSTTGSQCAFRGRMQLSPAGTQGRATLILGNSLATASANNARGELFLYGCGTGYTRFIPSNDTNANIEVYTPATGGTLALEKEGSVPIYYVQGPSTDTTAGTWTGSITGLTAYYDGLTVLYVPAVAGASATTLNINNLGAKTCYYTNTSALTTHYSVGTPILLTYRDNAWRRADYNSNTTYSAMSVSEGTTGTATTARTMRADYLKQIIAGLPSASCTGNAATATTATNTNNAKLTHTVGNTEYPLVFGSSFVITDAQQALRIGTPTETLANCALRCKAYCAAANTQGESYLVVGNNIAKTAANNSRGGLTMYGTGAYYLHFRSGDVTANRVINLLGGTADVTLTLPSATGTLALTSSNITGSSASCTGNAATATSATKIKTTLGAGAWYDIVGVATGFTSASSYAPYGHNSGAISFYVDANATSGNQRGILRLGNATANTTAAGHNGALWLYGTGTTYIDFRSNAAANKQVTIKTTGSTAREYTLPDKAGTFAMTSDVTAKVASGGNNASGYCKVNGNCLIQFGVIATSGANVYTVTLPTAFANTDYCVYLTTYQDYFPNNFYYYALQDKDGILTDAQKRKTTSFSFRVSMGATTSKMFWLAVGF